MEIVWFCFAIAQPAMKLPEGWRVWILVLLLNAAALALWYLDRDVAMPAPGGNLLQLIRSLAG